jgi:hypothetical protein
MVVAPAKGNIFDIKIGSEYPGIYLINKHLSFDFWQDKATIADFLDT